MYLTVENAADAMQCSKSTVKRMLNAGLLEYIEVGAGTRKSKRVKLPEPKTNQAAPKRVRRKEYVAKYLKLPSTKP